MSIALRLYNALWHIAPSMIRRHLKKRARQNPAYLEHWDERFGIPYPRAQKHVIWLHAVSLGETRGALPIVHALRAQFPEAQWLITQMTPAGRESAQMLFADAQCRYLPYDNPDFVRQFLDDHQPILALFMETEIWPNFVQQCAARRIPTWLVNARLSEKSYKGYARFASVFHDIFQSLTGVLAQTEDDALRLQQLGAHNITVCGSSKYDLSVSGKDVEKSREFRQKIGNRSVVLCASTREKNGVDEAHLLLDEWKNQHNNALLIIVPRHVERFSENADYARHLGFQVQRRSDNQSVDSSTQIWIGDSMGELAAYYLCADLAMIGGSLVDTGCQNLIESASCACPMLFGFSTYNFADSCRAALEAGIARQVQTPQEWAQVTCALLDDTEQLNAMRCRTHEWMRHHQGASEKMAKILADSLSKKGLP